VAVVVVQFGLLVETVTLQQEVVQHHQAVVLALQQLVQQILVAVVVVDLEQVDSAVLLVLEQPVVQELLL